MHAIVRWLLRWSRPQKSEGQPVDRNTYGRVREADSRTCLDTASSAGVLFSRWADEYERDSFSKLLHKTLRHDRAVYGDPGLTHQVAYADVISYAMKIEECGADGRILYYDVNGLRHFARVEARCELGFHALEHLEFELNKKLPQPHAHAALDLARDTLQFEYRESQNGRYLHISVTKGRDPMRQTVFDLYVRGHRARGQR